MLEGAERNLMVANKENLDVPPNPVHQELEQRPWGSRWPPN